MRNKHTCSSPEVMSLVGDALDQIPPHALRVLEVITKIKSKAIYPIAMGTRSEDLGGGVVPLSAIEAIEEEYRNA